MNFTKEINTVLSPAEIIAVYLGEPNQRSSNASWYCCVFHKEKTPSLQIFNEIDKGFYCRACHTGGTIVRFVEKYFNLNNLEACRKLDEDFNLNIIDKNYFKNETAELAKQRYLITNARKRLEHCNRFLTVYKKHLSLLDNFYNEDYQILCKMQYDSSTYKSVEQVNKIEKYMLNLAI